MIHRRATAEPQRSATLTTGSRPSPLLLPTALAAIALSALCGLRLAQAPDFSAGFAVPAALPIAAGPMVDDTVRDPAAGITHVASAVELPDGRLAAFWYEGTAEAETDVRIRMAVSNTGGWDAAIDVTDAARTGADQRRFVRFVGNPVAWRHPDGGYWLFYSTSSIGGWSMVQLNVMQSEDGLAWGPSRRLVTAPFFNMTADVKAMPLALADGRIALPVYTEFLGMFPEMLLIDRDGAVAGKSRMGGGGRQAIQPALAAGDGRNAVAFMRDMGPRRRLWRSATEDGGAHFSPLEQTAIPNPSSPVATTMLADRRLLMVGNLTDAAEAVLAVAVSADMGRTFTDIGAILDGRAENHSYRYPYLLQGTDGRLHLFVTEYFPGTTRRAIRHVTIPADRIPVRDGG